MLWRPFQKTLTKFYKDHEKHLLYIFHRPFFFKLLLTFKLLYYFDKIKFHFLHYKVHFSFWKQAENHIPNVILSEITTFKKF